MNNRNIFIPVTLAIVAGATLWLVSSVLTGKHEAWDAALYWSVFYPAAILISAVLGYTYPDRSWRWALILFESQALAMGIHNGELGNLWPLGMVLFAVIAFPAVIAATLTSRLSRSKLK
jgi:hypothetical protein